MTLSTWFGNMSQEADIIISLAIMMLAGFAMTRVTKRLHLPNVTAYILAGVLIGPYCLDLIPAAVIDGTAFLSDIALAFIAFGVGEFFKLPTLKKNGPGVIVLTLFEALIASVVVFCLMYFVLHLPMAFSIVLAALASATAPASTLMTIRQTGAHGHYVDALLQVVALDDVVSLLAYSVAISVALASSVGNTLDVGETILQPLLFNLLALVLGLGCGFLLRFMVTRRRSTDNRLIILLSILFLFCGVCALMDVSPLLGCMLIGTVYSNRTEDGKLFLQLNYFSPPILLLFFVRSGLSFQLDALAGAGTVGSVPLWLCGIVYFLARIAGKYAGAWLGCLVTHEKPSLRRYLGLALIPQAGVAIGLAALGARTLGGDTGTALETIILASSVLYELVGPGCAKLGLYLSGSYTSDLEELAPVEHVDATGAQKSEVELLIERIQKIQTELPPHVGLPEEEAEAAFTEAAEEQRNLLYGTPRTQPGLHRPQ